ncbi:peptidase [Alphaproteobacteria bacterium]|nr:peptidase [Alphaproteobacteria bacterium]
MDSLVNQFFRFFLPSKLSAKTEKLLKNIALFLGLLSAIAIIFDLYPLTMFLSFPFCFIWIYCAWLHTEPQLKWVNLIFLLIYLYGIARYFLKI